LRASTSCARDSSTSRISLKVSIEQSNREVSPKARDPSSYLSSLVERVPQQVERNQHHQLQARMPRANREHLTKIQQGEKKMNALKKPR
jgi:hypothetical protein